MSRAWKCVWVSVLLGIAGALPLSAEPDASAVSVELRAAWDDLLTSLQSAREAIDDPALHAPPESERGLAEGYRYLLGFAHTSFERAFFDDPDFPYFRRSIPPHAKATIDNSDNLYMSARIDGEGTYWIEGRAYANEHWRGGTRAAAGRLAPQYVLFSAITHYTADSGGMAELSPLITANTDSLDSTQIEVGPDGMFEILLAPERPEGHTGNFIATRAVKTVQGKERTFVARYLIGRELFGDWEREYPVELHIAREGMAGRAPKPLDPVRAAAQIREMGRLVDAKMRFWNEFYVRILDPYQQPGVTASNDLSINDIAQPHWTTGVGAAQATTTYGSGIYDLAPGEALVVEDHLADPPVYVGFNLSNFWGESYDYANHTSSLNDFQAQPDGDGVVRYVVAHEDPGVVNWIDTAGHRTGYMSRRWAYADREARLPTVRVKKVSLQDLFAHLPADTRRATPEDRRAQVEVRQRHTQRRYRQY